MPLHRTILLLGESSQLKLPLNFLLTETAMQGNQQRAQLCKQEAVVISSAYIPPPDTGLTPPAQATRHGQVLFAPSPSPVRPSDTDGRFHVFPATFRLALSL